MTQNDLHRGTPPKTVNRPHIEIRPLRSGGHRVVFLYPYKQEFAAAARALKIRGHLLFGENPLPGKYNYKAFYYDIRGVDAETYAAYAMLVRDFYGKEIQDKFNAIFPGLDHASIRASIHNPNAYMEAQRPIVEALIEKYRGTKTPLEFYDSKHMAEGIAMLLSMFEHPELKGFILADEQGMAKTLQIIIAAIEKGLKRVLIVSTKSGSDISWPDELHKAQAKPKIYRGGPDRLGPSSYQWVILTWDDLRRFEAIEKIIANRRRPPETPPLEGVEQAWADIKEFAGQFELLVLDEGHYAQDEDSQRSIGADCFAKFIPHVVPATGTPVAKRPRNAYNLLRLVGHPLAKDKEAFLARYEGDKDEENNTLMPQRYEELHHLLKDAYIRREKSQTNMPAKTRPVRRIFFTDQDRKAMDDMWAKFLVDNKEKIEKDTYPLDAVKSGKYYEFCAIRKAIYVADWAEDLAANGQKVTLFTGSTEVYEYWMKRFGSRAAGINGDVQDRKAQEHRFTNDPRCMFFCGNIVAAGESITLVVSHILAFNDITSRPKNQLQAEDRNHRGGQTEDCEANYFVADTEEDEREFNRFVNDKEVIQSIANVRNADGTITDAAWTGELAGTAAALQSKLIKTAFDWEDAGEEPPKPEKVKETLATMPAYKRNMIQKGNAKRRARKEGARVADDDEGIGRQLRTVIQYLGSPKEADFARSLVKWNADGRAFTDKQKSAAMKLLERNIHRLVGVS
jgi:hypothetical protein